MDYVERFRGSSDEEIEKEVQRLTRYAAAISEGMDELLDQIDTTEGRMEKLKATMATQEASYTEITETIFALRKLQEGDDASDDATTNG